MPFPRHPVAVLNRSASINDADVQKIVSALQVQADRDLAPVWGVSARFAFYGKGKKPPPGAWWLVFAESSDEANALGYHDLTNEGLPLGKVFVKTTLDAGDLVSVTASHEGCELLVDPWICGCYTVTENGQDVFYAAEISDAIEADQYGYQIDGVTVSDFVTPAWFNPAAPKGSVFDYGRHLSRPYQLLGGGYIGKWTAAGGWKQELPPDASPSHRLCSRGMVGSRRERRRIPIQERVRSTGS